MAELKKLFLKFDLDGSGSLDMDEIMALFTNIGIETDKVTIKKIFESAHDVKLKHDELQLVDFQRVMLNEKPKRKFKEFVNSLRSNYRDSDFTHVKCECKFLPIDLSLMMAFMFQKIIHLSFDEFME